MFNKKKRIIRKLESRIHGLEVGAFWDKENIKRKNLTIDLYKNALKSLNCRVRIDSSYAIRDMDGNPILYPEHPDLSRPEYLREQGYKEIATDENVYETIWIKNT